MHPVSPTIFRVSPLRWTGVLLGALAFVAIGVFMLADPQTENVVFGWLAIAFFGFCAVVAATRLFKRGPEVTLDDNGLVVRDGPRITWSEVDSVGVRAMGTTRSTEVVEVVLRDPQAYLARLTGAAAMAAKANAALGFSPVNIPYLGGSKPPGAVIAAMRRHHPSLAVTAHPADRPSPVRRLKRIGVRVLGWGALVIVLFVGITLWLDKTGDISTARVGKCLSIQGDDGDTAKVVDCGSSDARFKVIGQIDHQSKDASDAHDVCDAYPGTAVQFWYGESGKEGVVWCLALNSP